MPAELENHLFFGKIAQDANKKGNRVLVLIHRIQLKNQHSELFEEYGIDKEMTRVESVFTEVNHLGEHGKVDLIIIDEAHLSRCIFISKSVRIL